MGALDRLIGVPVEPFLSEQHLNYRVFHVPKRGGAKKWRQIEAPSADLASAQQKILHGLLMSVEPHPGATAYYKGRSPIANARVHLGCRHLLKLDFLDFFPSIKTEMVLRALQRHVPFITSSAASEVAAIATLGGYLPQGAPTSPHLSNLVLFDFDSTISDLAQKSGARYTRYADDIALSAGDEAVLIELEAVVAFLAARLGLKLNYKKRRLIGPDSEKIVTGLNVTGPGLRPTRRFRKRTAAMVRARLKYEGEKKHLTGCINGSFGYWRDVCHNDPELAQLEQLIKDR